MRCKYMMLQSGLFIRGMGMQILVTARMEFIGYAYPVMLKHRR